MNKKHSLNSKWLRPWLWRWHRRSGLAAALVIIVVSVTGVFLNHTSELSLGSKPVKQPWLLSYYGIETPTFSSYPLAEQWLSGDNKQQLYLGGEFLTICRGLLKGAAIFEEGFVVACEQELLLFNQQGEIIEKMGTIYGLPVPVTRLGNCDSHLCIATEQRIFQFDANQLDFKPLGNPSVLWYQPLALPVTIEHALITKYQGRGLSWERVLLDLHSGRLLGKTGVWLFDAAAILLLFLALSGFILWYQQTQRKR